MKTFTRKSSLTRKLLFFMILIGLVPLLLFGVLSILVANSMIQDRTLAFHQQLLEQRKQYINLVMSDVESLIANLAGNEEIHAALSNDAPDVAYDRLVTQSRIGYILSGYSNLKGLVSIDIFTAFGNQFHVGETLQTADIDILLKERLEAEAISSGKYVHWSGVESNINRNSQYPRVVTAVKELHGATDPEGKSAILIVSYDPAVFSAELAGISTENGYSMVLDSKMRIVYHPDWDLIGQMVSEGITRQFSADAGSFVSRIDGSDQMVIYSNNKEDNWIVASFVPLSSMHRENQLISIILCMLLVLSVCIIVVFSRQVSRWVVIPIRLVTDTFRALQGGDLTGETRFMLGGDDEIGELGSLFNSFIDAREDITTQKKLERQLNEQNDVLQQALDDLTATQVQMIQQEKMAGIGQLAAGVAHEINNPLSYVSGNIGIMDQFLQHYEHVLDEVAWVRENIPSDSEPNRRLSKAWQAGQMDSSRKEIGEMLKDIKEGTGRITAIVSGLKDFSRTNPADEKMPYNLNDGIRTTLLIANGELGGAGSVDFQEGDIPVFMANGGQVNQVLLNIMVNAAHAVRESREPQDGRISISTCTQGDSVCCRIADNGYGMSEAVRARIFEPFFTTKKIGQGTGLGMSISYDIVVNKHGGRIDVESEEGMGSVFSICFPITPAL